MEHIIQYTINVDDDNIKRRIEDCGYNDIIKHFVEETEKHMPKKYYGKEIDWDKIVGESVKEFLTDNKEEIMEIVTNKIVDSFKRTKSYKEKISEVL